MLEAAGRQVGIEAVLGGDADVVLGEVAGVAVEVRGAGSGRLRLQIPPDAGVEVVGAVRVDVRTQRRREPVERFVGDLVALAGELGSVESSYGKPG